jgi:ATP-dependent helicase Lhr and Lhr-like helicase
LTADPVRSPSTAFGFLHEKVQRWIWRQGWDSLRDVQEQSIPVLLAGDRDLIITAGTASGKTEAAFLAIISRLAAEHGSLALGFLAIYVCPLRALINDQFAALTPRMRVALWSPPPSYLIPTPTRRRSNDCTSILQS